MLKAITMTQKILTILPIILISFCLFNDNLIIASEGLKLADSTTIDTTTKIDQTSTESHATSSDENIQNARTSTSSTTSTSSNITIAQSLPFTSILIMIIAPISLLLLAYFILSKIKL